MGRLRRTAGLLGRAVIGGVILGVLLLGYFQFVGLPEGARLRLLRRLSSTSTAVEADDVRLRAPAGFTADGVRVYAKREVGPPLLSAKTVSVSADPLSLLSDGPPVMRLDVAEGAVSRRWLSRRRSASPGGDTRSGGRMRLYVNWNDVDFLGMTLDRFRGQLDLRNGDWEFTDMRSSLSRGDPSGVWSGRAAFDWRLNTVSGQLDSELDPHIVIPLLEFRNMAFPVRLIRRFRFDGNPPRCETRFTLRGGPSPRFESKSRIRMDNVTYLGYTMRHAQADVGIRVEGGHATVELDPLLVERPEGAARVKVAYNGAENDILFRGDSTVHPKAVTGMIGILTNGVLDAFEFDPPFHAVGGGLVALRDRRKTDVTVRVKSGAAHFKRLTAKECAFTLRLTGATNWIEQIEGYICGGRLNGRLGLVRAADSWGVTAYTGRVEVADADFTDLGFVFAPSTSNAMTGRLTLRGTFGGPSGPGYRRQMTGRGSLDIRDGRVFSLPLFGGFSRIMKRLIPGLDFVLRQSDVSAAFTIADGAIHAHEVHVKGDVLSLSGSGTVTFGGDLGFLVRVRLMKEHTFVAKLIAPLVYPLSKLFEFRLHGTLEDPKWYPVNFSRDMLRRLGLVDELVDDDEVLD